MKTTNLEKIRKACIAANPEIMELRFGCFIKLEGSNPLMLITGNCSPMRVLDGLTIFEVAVTDNFKILGRDIRLADVVYLLHNIDKNIPLSPDMSINIDDLVNQWWDLKNDNLESQSSETLAFIASLLPNKTET